MKKLDTTKRIQILQMLCEGSSMNSISRIADVSFHTVAKLLVDAGNACLEYQDKAFHNLQCKRVQVDEMWAFCFSNEKNIPEEQKEEFGYCDIWTYTAICADSKLVPSWRVGRRNAYNTYEFIRDTAGRMAHRIQLTIDANHAYLITADDAFSSDIDYGQIVKMYHDPESMKRENIYSPSKIINAKKFRANGMSDRKHISTSFIEWQSLNMSMGMRRFTRLTNAFSKKVEKHCHALSLYFMFYNFVRIHKSMRVTPAMAAEIADHSWSFEEILFLIN